MECIPISLIIINAFGKIVSIFKKSDGVKKKTYISNCCTDVNVELVEEVLEAVHEELCENSLHSCVSEDS